MVCEVMGRHAGHIALHAGIAGGAAFILVPEEPFDIEEVCERLKVRHASGRYASIVVVAEGASPKEGTLALQDKGVDAFGHVRLGGIGNLLAEEIEARTGFETRVTILGHVQRGGTPTAYDRILSTRFGIAAIDAVHDGAFGHMVALRHRPPALPPRRRGLLRLTRLRSLSTGGCTATISRQRTDGVGGRLSPRRRRACRACPSGRGHARVRRSWEARSRWWSSPRWWWSMGESSCSMPSRGGRWSP